MDNATHYGEKTNTGVKARVDYIDAQNGKTVLFSDKGNKLTTAIKTPDEQQIQDMLTLAQSKGWKSIKVSGSRDFKQQVYVLAQSQGIAVKGYTPTAEDLARVEQLREKNSTNRIEENKHIQQKGSLKTELDFSSENKEAQAFANAASDQIRNQSSHIPTDAQVWQSEDSGERILTSIDKGAVDGKGETPAEVYHETEKMKSDAYAMPHIAKVSVNKKQPYTQQRAALEEAKSNYKEKVKTLTGQDKARLKMYQDAAAAHIAQQKSDKRMLAWQHYYEYTANKIQDGKLNLPKPIPLNKANQMMEQAQQVAAPTKQNR
jgi:hypothetical protein